MSNSDTFFTVCGRIIVCNKSDVCGVICNFYDDVVRMGSNTIMREKSVQHWAEYRALRGACIHNHGAGVVFSEGDMLRSTGEGSSVSSFKMQKAGPGYTACL